MAAPLVLSGQAVAAEASTVKLVVSYVEAPVGTGPVLERSLQTYAAEIRRNPAAPSVEILRESGVIGRHATNGGVRLLAKGELKAKINITVDAVSENARAAVEAAGGSVTLIEKREVPRKEGKKAARRAASAVKRAERLAGAMSSFRPGGARGGIGAYIGYSPLCVPRVINGVKCVIVNEALRGVEPMAWDFVMNFARDNRLQMAEACLVPESAPPKAV